MEIWEATGEMTDSDVAIRLGFMPSMIPGYDSMSREELVRWCVANSPPAMESERLKFYRGKKLHVVCSPEGEILGAFNDLEAAFVFMAPMIFQSRRLLVEQPDRLKEQYVLSILPELPRDITEDFPIQVNNTYLVLNEDGCRELDEEEDAGEIESLFDGPEPGRGRVVLYEEKGKDVICEPWFEDANLLVGHMLVAHEWMGRLSGRVSPSRLEILGRAGVFSAEEPAVWKDRKITRRVLYCSPRAFSGVMHAIELDAARTLMSAKVLMVSRGCPADEVEAISTLEELNRHPFVAGL